MKFNNGIWTADQRISSLIPEWRFWNPGRIKYRPHNWPMFGNGVAEESSLSCFTTKRMIKVLEIIRPNLITFFSCSPVYADNGRSLAYILRTGTFRLHHVPFSFLFIVGCLMRHSYLLLHSCLSDGSQTPTKKKRLGELCHIILYSPVTIMRQCWCLKREVVKLSNNKR